MTAESIRDRISECCTLFGFVYQGKQCDVDPYSESKFDLFCDGETKTVHSIEAVMSEPFFCGKSLEEICDQIQITDY